MSSLAIRLKAVSSALAGVAILAGCLALFGWLFDVPILKSLVPGLTAMKANAAVAFVLAGLSLALLGRGGRGRWPGRLAGGCALAVALVGLLTLGEYLAGWDLGIDQLLFRDVDPAIFAPGRMAPNTALGFLLVGCALLLTAWSTRHLPAAQTLGLLATLIALLALVGYVYGEESLVGIGPYVRMALPTALAFLALGLGVLFARPDRGLMELGTSDSAGGFLVRRLVLTVTAVPLILGWLVVEGHRLGFYGERLGTVVLALSSLVVLAVFVSHSGWSLHRTDLRRRRAEAERERLSRELADRVAELQAVLEAAPVAVWIAHDPECRRITGNAHADRLMRAPHGANVSLSAVPGDEVVSYRVLRGGVELRPEELPAQVAASTGQPVQDQVVELLFSDGRSLHLLESAVPLIDAEGRVRGALAAGVDVTPIKQAEAERERLLAEVDMRRRHFEAVFRNASAGMAVLSGPDFAFTMINPAYQAIAPGKDILGKTLADVWPELAPQVTPLLERVRQTGETYWAVDIPFPIRRGPEAPLEEGYFTFSYVPLAVPEGHPDQILALVMETTEQVRARLRIEELAALAQRRADQLQSVLDNMVDGVFVSNAEGLITLTNQAGVTLVGLDSPPGVKSPPLEIREPVQTLYLNGAPIPSDNHPLARALRGETLMHEDLVIRNPRSGKDVYVRISAAPLKDEKGSIVGAVSVARDVTELTELDRLKDQFIAVAAHELKTPVAVMKGYAQLLSRRVEVAPERRKILDAISQGADQIDGIVKDLLDISRLQLGHLELSMERINICELAELAAREVAENSSRHHLRVESCEPVVVHGDRERIEQVLTNLLDNAVRYSPKGGTIDVEVYHQDCEVVISVRDRGVGIPRDKQAKIFQRFYRAHTNTPYDYGGMGVGLFISREIVTKHGGRMWFESQEGLGSTFCFSLPLRSTDVGE